MRLASGGRAIRYHQFWGDGVVGDEHEAKNIKSIVKDTDGL
jgi:hypothetical protein